MDIKNVHLEQKCETPISYYSEQVTWETVTAFLFNEWDWKVLRSILLQQIFLVADQCALVDTFVGSDWEGNIFLSLKPKTSIPATFVNYKQILKVLFKKLFKNRKVIHLLISHHSNRIKIDNWFQC